MSKLTGDKKQLIHRVAGIQGHVGSLKNMIEEDREALEILMQLSAIRSALERFSFIVFEEFVELRLESMSGEGDRQEAIAEIRGALQTLL